VNLLIKSCQLLLCCSYACDDYVLNDNAAGDIKLLRSALSAIATQMFTHMDMRGKRLLRSYSHSGVIQRYACERLLLLIQDLR